MAETRPLCKCHGEPMNKRGRHKSGRQRWECSENCRSRARRYYREGKRPVTEQVRVNRRRSNSRKARRMRQYLRDLKQSAACKSCGSKTAKLHFHHQDPESKLFSVGTGSGSHSWKKLKAEIAKCDLLCAKCHSEAHRLLESEGDE